MRFFLNYKKKTISGLRNVGHEEKPKGGGGSCSVEPITASGQSVFLISYHLYVKLLLFPSERDFTLSFPPPPDKQDRYFGLRICAGESLFSLTPKCHFLTLHSISPQNPASCPSLVATEVPPTPSGMSQDFTLSLRNIQEV